MVGWLRTEADSTDPSPGSLTSNPWNTPLVGVRGTHITGVDEYIRDCAVEIHDYRVARVDGAHGPVKVGNAECCGCESSATGGGVSGRWEVIGLVIGVW